MPFYAASVGAPTSTSTDSAPDTGANTDILGISSEGQVGTYGTDAVLTIQPVTGTTSSSTSIKFAWEAYGAIDAFTGTQVAAVTNYVDNNNYIAAVVQRNASSKTTNGDLTFFIKQVRAGVQKVLHIQTTSITKDFISIGQEPTKYISLSVLPQYKRADGLWPITASIWFVGSPREALIKTVYSADVGDKSYFDSNRGVAAKGFWLPTSNTPGGPFSYSLRDIEANAYDLDIEYSIEADTEEPAPPLTSGTVQGVALTAPFCIEQITKVVYEACSSDDASTWGDWEVIGESPLEVSARGFFLHAATVDTRYYRYRATYTYIGSSGAVRTTGKSDYRVFGAGILTAGGLSDLLRSGGGVPAQPSTQPTTVTNSTALRWVDPLTGGVLATDFARVQGIAGTSSSVASRILSVIHPATPITAAASIELEAGYATPLIRVTAGNISKVLLRSDGTSELGGGGGGDVSYARHLFFS
jgi:hypothetical protein